VRVGIRIRGGGRLGIVGGQSNTFTGDVFVLDHSALSLRKDNKAIAVQGDIYIKNGSNLTLDKGAQIARTSTVSLQDSSFSFFNFGYFNTPISQSLHRLKVEGSSFFNFSPYNYRQELILDDLLINRDGLLTIRSWRDQFHFLLIRKDSEHLQDALGKIKFAGQEQKRAGLKEYNSDYWKIGPGFPEPTTYGAIFGAVGLGLAVWRKRRRVSLLA